MPWTSSKEGTLPSLKNKSLEARKIFAEVANAALAKGRSEEESIIAGLGAVNQYEKKNKKTQTKSIKPPVPSHLRAILEARKAVSTEVEEDQEIPLIHQAFLGKNALTPNQERSLVSARWDEQGRLILQFDTGERIITEPVPITEYVRNQVYVSQESLIPSVYDHIQFDTASTTSADVGMLVWNDTDGTLDLGLKGGNVTLQIGQEQLVHIYNNTDNAFSDMQVLRITGSQGQRLTGALAQANSELTSSTTFAVVTEPILKNQIGFATTSGIVRNVNTLAFPEGAALYLSPTAPGEITATKPVAPNHMVLIGWCIRSHQINGSIYVHVQNGFELNELHDVLISNLANGDIIKYDNAAKVWKNQPFSIEGMTIGAFIPSSPSDVGQAGTIRLDSDYIYVCVATDTWKRLALSTW